jgi:hypothetical protein
MIKKDTWISPGANSDGNREHNINLYKTQKYSQTLTMRESELRQKNGVDLPQK